MADIKKVKLPDNSEYNIKDYRIPGVDTEPTSGSDNVITSGGIYAANYAGSTSNGGPANMTVSIPFAKPDATSTSTAYTVQVDGITELRDGVCFYLMNDRVTSASGFTVNVNDLGAKRVYLTTAAATRATTQMAVNYTWLLVYNETRYSDGCWDLVYTFNSNTTYTLNYLFDGSPWYVQHTLYRYQLMFQVNEKTVTPLNANSNTTGTTKTIHTDYEFDPFGKIFYYSTTSTVSANTTVGATYCAFVRAAVDLRYTFNVSTSVNPLSLDYSPVYLKININSTTGMATLNSNLPLTQTLPTTNDGIYYLYLGRSTTTKYTCSLEAHHPIYYHNGTTLCELLQEETLNGIEDKLNFVAISDYEDDTLVISAALNDLNDRTEVLEEAIQNVDSEEMTSVTYTELVALRDGNQLKPGHQYRITDYVTTVRQTHCESAEHPFDIIVTADSANTLNENARAALHPGDNYFNMRGYATYDFGSIDVYGIIPHLEQWELKYCLDNDDKRFGWAEPGIPYIIPEVVNGDWTWEEIFVRDPYYDNNNFYCWRLYRYSSPWNDHFQADSRIFTLSETPNSSDTIYDANGDTIDPYSSGEPATVGTYYAPSEGKGVIYYMKDEYGNCAPYDFKNIMYKRKYYSDVHFPEGGSLEAYNYFYTFNSLVIDSNGTDEVGCFDSTLLLNGLGFYTDGGKHGCINNYLGSYYDVIDSVGYNEGQSFMSLPDTVVWTTFYQSDSVPLVQNIFVDRYDEIPNYFRLNDRVIYNTSCYSKTFMPYQNLYQSAVTGSNTRGLLADTYAIYKAIHPNVVSFNSIPPNVLYTAGSITTSSKTFSLKTSGIDSNISNHYFWTFETGATAPTITWPSGLTWPGGSPPAILPNKHYEISVLNNYVAWMEV